MRFKHCAKVPGPCEQETVTELLPSEVLMLSDRIIMIPTEEGSALLVPWCQSRQ